MLVNHAVHAKLNGHFFISCQGALADSSGKRFQWTELLVRIAELWGEFIHPLFFYHYKSEYMNGRISA